MPVFLKFNLQFFAADPPPAAGVPEETKTLITKLGADVTKASTELKALMDQQAEEIRKHGETSSNTAAAVQKAEEKMVKFESDIKGINDQIDEFKKAARASKLCRRRRI